jgi:hypothetical protein
MNCFHESKKQSACSGFASTLSHAASFKACSGGDRGGDFVGAQRPRMIKPNCRLLRKE